MTEKLKPCPFCGGEAALWKTLSGDYHIECINMCDIKPGTLCYHTKEKAITAWNTRVIDNSEAYKLLHKTLLAVWALIPNVEKGAALDELLVCANEIEKFLSQIDEFEDDGHA